jgi:hypothetical protein
MTMPASSHQATARHLYAVSLLAGMDLSRDACEDGPENCAVRALAQRRPFTSCLFLSFPLPSLGSGIRKVTRFVWQRIGPDLKGVQVRNQVKLIRS